MLARGTIDLGEIARPEILDASRIEWNHQRRYVVLVRHRTTRAEPAVCLIFFSMSISILVACKSPVVDLFGYGDGDGDSLLDSSTPLI
jgi:hypothetical protein